MKTKKRVAILLMTLVFMLLLFGCAGSGGELESTTNMPTEGSQGTDPMVYYGITSNVKPAPREESSWMIEYDPDREVYILCDNVYRDIYAGVSTNTDVSIYILSKEQLDTDSIIVTVPETMCPYVLYNTNTVFDAGTEVNADYSASNAVMPYYLYQVYRGYPFWDTDPETEEMRTKLDEILLADFKTLQPEDLPTFYLYSYSIVYFTEELTEDWVTESYDHIQITIGDQVYDQQIGRVRILPKSEFPSEHETCSMLGPGMMLSGMGSSKGYSDGISDYLNLGIEASEDMTISDFRLIGMDTELLDITVEHTSGDYTMSYSWNGTDPIDLLEGDRVLIYPIIRNPLIDAVSCDISYICAVDAQMEDGSWLCCTSSFQYGITFRNWYEMYAIIFDGVDMEAYYRDYYYRNFELWRNDFVG